MLSDAYGDIDNPALKPGLMPGWISTSGMPMEPQSLRTKTGQQFPSTPDRFASVIKLWPASLSPPSWYAVAEVTCCIYPDLKKHAGSAKSSNATGDRTPGRNTAMLTIAAPADPAGQRRQRHPCTQG